MTNEQMDKLQAMIDKLPLFPWTINCNGLIEASDETMDAFATEIGITPEWHEGAAEYLLMCGNFMPEILQLLKDK